MTGAYGRNVLSGAVWTLPTRRPVGGGYGMEFEVLGPLPVREGTVTAPMSRMLLGILLCRANTRVSVDVLVDALWAGQPDPGASKKLQLHVHRLRRALVDPDRVRFEHSGYLLRVHPGELDADRFESMLAEGTDAVESGEPARGAEVIRKALGLWRGDPYGDMADMPLLRVPTTFRPTTDRDPEYALRIIVSRLRGRRRRGEAVRGRR